MLIKNNLHPEITLPVQITPEKKIHLVTTEKKISIMYSAKKIKAKFKPEYSVLKPETSSDSDSLKSKGARWVSANTHTTQTKRIAITSKLQK